MKYTFLSIIGLLLIGLLLIGILFNNQYPLYKTYVQHKLYLTHANNAGFFSTCSVKLYKIIEFYINNNNIPSNIDGSQLFQLYNPNKNIDITYEFFKPSNNINLNITDYPRHISTNFNEMIDPNNDDQYMNYKLIDFKNINPYIQKFFTPSDKIINTMNKLIAKYNINFNKSYCGVYYRGTDKIHETVLPNYDSFITKMNNIQNIDNNIIFIIQSDDQIFIDYIKSRFTNNIIFEENKGSTINNGIHHNNTKIENFNDILYMLPIMLILSRCKYIICNSSNCSKWITLYRGTGNNIIQYFNGNWF
jgi:hypothetical protein